MGGQRGRTPPRRPQQGNDKQQAQQPNRNSYCEISKGGQISMHAFGWLDLVVAVVLTDRCIAHFTCNASSVSGEYSNGL
jgi:hypothetical protein